MAKRFNPFDPIDVANVEKFIKERNDRIMKDMTSNYVHSDRISDTMQMETIIWNKYPEEKPTVGTTLLVQYNYIRFVGKEKEILPTVTLALYNTRESTFYHIAGQVYMRNEEIIAWAKMPEGFKNG